MVKNPKVVLFSILALIFIVLTFTVHWAFILPAVFLWYLNKKELSVN
tara:strand:+ start:2900 stop:3040 length:141 start_codon:yes stop_codon:yes gene_type:complete